MYSGTIVPVGTVIVTWGKKQDKNTSTEKIMVASTQPRHKIQNKNKTKL